MKSITIKGSQRESVGKVATKTLRDAGKVPCVLYGGNNPLHFSADELLFSKLVYTPEVHTVVIELENGKKHDAIVQNIQFHPISDKILHIDFFELHANREITMDIPVHIIGKSKGVLAGGVLQKNKRKLRIKALPAHLPDFIEVDITPLGIGDKLYSTDLKNKAYKLLHPDNMVVCQVRRSRVVVEEADIEAKTTETPVTENTPAKTTTPA